MILSTGVKGMLLSHLIDQGLSVGLFQNDWFPAPSDQFEDYQAADFDGYDSQGPSWSDEQVNVIVWRYTDSPLTYTKTGTETSNTIYGYYVWYEIFNGETTDYYFVGAERFENQIEMDTENQAIVFDLTICFEDTGGCNFGE